MFAEEVDVHSCPQDTRNWSVLQNCPGLNGSTQSRSKPSVKTTRLVSLAQQAFQEGTGARLTKCVRLLDLRGPLAVFALLGDCRLLILLFIILLPLILLLLRQGRRLSLLLPLSLLRNVVAKNLVWVRKQASAEASQRAPASVKVRVTQTRQTERGLATRVMVNS